MDARAILERLIAFDTVSDRPNRALMDWVAGLLADAGVEAVLIPDAGGGKANLYATVGPAGVGGVMLSGHTDVVPVEGQAWTRPAFELTEAEGRLYGRGTADMKGFVACAIAAVLGAAQRELRVPLHLALSYDEEIGCMGVRSMITMLEGAPVRPRMCIVGEPTGMAVATGHKGKVALRATCVGREGHSALAPLALNALHLAADFVGVLRGVQARVAAEGMRDGDYDVPYTTLHVGKLNGGVQVNIVPQTAVADWEIRSLAGEDVAGLIAEVRGRMRGGGGALAGGVPGGGDQDRAVVGLSRAGHALGCGCGEFRQGADRGEWHDQGGLWHRRRAVRCAVGDTHGDLRARVDGAGAQAG